MRLWNGLKIRQQIIISIVVILLVFTVSLVIISIASIRTTGTAALRGKGASLAIITAETVKPAVQYSVGEDTEKVLTQLIAGDSDVSVAAVVVQDSKGEYTVTNKKTSKAYETVDLSQPLKQLGVHAPEKKGDVVTLGAGTLQFLASKIDLTANDALQNGYVLLALNNTRISHELNDTAMIMVVVGFLMILLGTACAYFIARKITKPLGGEPDYAAHIVQEISQGNLTVDVVVAVNDKASLLAAIKVMAENLRAMVGKIRDTTSQVATVADQIADGSTHLTRAAHGQASASDETSSTMVQMAASIQTVANNAESLAANADEVASSIQELGASSEQVAKSADVMATSVAESSATIEQMTVSIEKVARNTEDLASSVTETSSTVEQMTVSIDHVAGNSQELQETVAETSATVEQMAVSIRQVAKNVAEADAVAKTAAREGLSGQKAVQDALAAMKRVSEVSNRTAASIINLGQRSEEIGKIVSVINEIADQTNLLALNAAIEAARAGDAGRGFAVVADEVRKLAERSVKATEEIGQVIKQVQADTADSVKFGELAAREAQTSMELSGDAGNALGNIVRNIEQTSNLMSDVAVMTAEQANASDQVIRSVEKMSHSAKQVANAAREQAVGGRQIRIAIERMNGITQEVTEATREQAKGGKQIRIAVETMNSLTQQVTIATRQQALSARQIAGSINAMNSMTQQVAGATGEQKKGGELVVQSVKNISDLTRENLSSVEQLAKSAESLSRQAVDLEQMVAQFKVQ